MVNLELLEKAIADSGMTDTFICKKTGIENRTLYNRRHGKGDFKAMEILALSKVLRLSNKRRDEIFFAENVTGSN